MALRKRPRNRLRAYRAIYVAQNRDDRVDIKSGGLKRDQLNGDANRRSLKLTGVAIRRGGSSRSRPPGVAKAPASHQRQAQRIEIRMADHKSPSRSPCGRTQAFAGGAPIINLCTFVVGRSVERNRDLRLSSPCAAFVAPSQRIARRTVSVFSSDCNYLLIGSLAFTRSSLFAFDERNSDPT